MVAWILLIVLADPAAMPLASLHGSPAACERRAEAEMERLARAGAGVVYVTCQPVRAPALRPVTGELVD